MPKVNLTKPRKLLNPELYGVTTQMKVLIEYILMVVFMLLLSTVDAKFHVQFEHREITQQRKG